jgi:hypothetical protein
MPIMVVGRRDICPTTTGKSPEQPNTSNELGKSRVRPCSKKIPKENESESRTGGNGDEDLKE